VIAAESPAASLGVVELQGNNVTLDCESDNGNALLSWYNSTCKQKTTAVCRPSEIVYDGWKINQAFASRFSVIGRDTEQSVVRHLFVSRLQVSDGGLYVCRKDTGGVIAFERHELTVLSEYACMH